MSNANARKINPLLILLCVVLAAALVVSVMFLKQRDALNDQVDTLTAELDASRTSWQTTAAAKELLQAELDAANDAIKEANLTIEESASTSAKMNEQIATLTTENAALATELETARAAKAQLDTEFAAVADKAAAALAN